MTSARHAIFPLNTVLYPGGPLPLRIFETRYVDMVGQCMRSAAPFVVAAIDSGNETGEASFHDVGTLASIVDFQQMPDGLLGILVKGGQRVRIHEKRRETDGLNTGAVELLPVDETLVVPEEYEDLVTLLHQLLEQIPADYYPESERKFDDASWAGYRLAELLPLGNAQKQYFLEMSDPLRRLELIRPLLESMQVEQQS